MNLGARCLGMKSKRSQNAVILGYLQALWLPFLVCGLLAASAVDLVPRLTHSDCEMTWMFSWPQYQRLNLSLELREAYPQYGLHLYRETRNREEPLLDAAPLRLRGLPALFIPGNAGSHKQGWYIATVFRTSVHFLSRQFVPQPP